MKQQANKLGDIVQGDDPNHPTIDEREEIIQNALSMWGWNVEIERHAPQGRFVKFTANTSISDDNYTLEIFIFPNLADSARSRPHEKRIQLTREYSEHREEFELDKSSSHKCLLLGLYCLENNEIIICAWDAAAYKEHATPTSCYVHIQAIADAFRFGFARSQDAKSRYVCCFRPEFMYYYINNIEHLHNVEVEKVINIHNQTEVDDTNVTGAKNIIFYGAPGTGKTHAVEGLIAENKSVRTVFHPDFQSSDFIGALKPIMKEDKITYAFSPGPFAQALIKALKNPDKEVYLVIEELNRAPAAAVFGELFLLLDRDENGKSTYSVNFPTQEFKIWLNDSLECSVEHISLPSNLWLVSTMNSADQGVYPIDTAFRRRWDQKYVPLDYSNAPPGKLEIVFGENNIKNIEWIAFAECINNYLLEHLEVAEDRLLGPWFVTAEELSSSNKIPGKVLIYLWDDLLRHHGREKVFDLNNVKTYGKVDVHINNGKRIFSDELLSKLANLIPK